MKKKYILNAEIQILGILSFLFISFCAGFGFVYGLPEIKENPILQFLIVLISIFIHVFGFWITNTFFKIYKSLYSES
jgi:cell shape-determining protein MreD